MNTKEIFQSENEEIKINVKQLQQLLQGKEVLKTMDLICNIALDLLGNLRNMLNNSETKPAEETKESLNILTDIFGAAENFETLMNFVRDGEIELIYNPASLRSSTKESEVK